MTAPLTPLTGGRRRPSVGRRLARDISSVLIITGLLLLADAAVTLLWQEPLTAVVAMIKRGEIDKRLLSSRTNPLSPLDQRTLEAMASVLQRTAFLARREERQVGTGVAIGRIAIPRIGLNAIVVQGTDTASLEKGPGHYASTGCPGPDLSHVGAEPYLELADGTALQGLLSTGHGVDDAACRVVEGRSVEHLEV